nr:hydroxyacid dehydrogenase [Microlunatus panaciterrae]
MGSNELLERLFTPELRDRLASVADVVSGSVLTEFDSAEARAVLAGIDVLITGWGCPKVTPEVLDRAPSLRLIAHSAGTVKGHLHRACWERGVAVTTAAQVNGVPVAEFTLAVILLAGKDAFNASSLARQTRSGVAKTSLAAEIGNVGTTVGIIGASSIGRAVLQLLRPFKHRRLLADPTISAAEAAELGAELVPLDELMARSRIVSLHAPILPSTIGMIGAAQLQAMPDGATFINTARGVLVDHDALRAETGTGRISAFLDVTDPEPLPEGDLLYTLPNVVITPHIAGSLGNELPLMAASAVTEVEHLAAAEPLVHEVTLQVLDTMA